MRPQTTTREGFSLANLSDFLCLIFVSPDFLFLLISEMAKRLVPLLNRVLVEKIVPPAKTHAGILLPEKASKVSQFSELLDTHFTFSICSMCLFFEKNQV